MANHAIITGNLMTDLVNSHAVFSPDVDIIDIRSDIYADRVDDETWLAFGFCDENRHEWTLTASAGVLEQVIMEDPNTLELQHQQMLLVEMLGMASNGRGMLQTISVTRLKLIIGSDGLKLDIDDGVDTLDLPYQFSDSMVKTLRDWRSKQ